MHFSIAFKLPNDDCLHLRNLTSSVGLDLLEEVREEIKANCPANHIDVENSCPEWNNKVYRINISNDKFLQQIPQFRAREHVTIIVPDGYLGKYWNMQIVNKGFNCGVGYFRRMYASSKMTSNFKVSFELDEKSLLEDWISDGCKEFWGITEEQADSVVSADNKYYIIQRSSYNPPLNVSYHGEVGIGSNVQDIVRTHKIFEDNPTEIQSVVQCGCLIQTMELLASRLDKDELNRLYDFTKTQIEKVKK